MLEQLRQHITDQLGFLEQSERDHEWTQVIVESSRRFAAFTPGKMGAGVKHLGESIFEELHQSDQLQEVVTVFGRRLLQ